jgi:hypothetical protein
MCLDGAATLYEKPEFYTPLEISQQLGTGPEKIWALFSFFYSRFRTETGKILKLRSYPPGNCRPFVFLKCEY